MSKIIIDKQVLEDWIKYIDTFPLYPEDRVKLKSILQQGEEYDENEAIGFGDWLKNNYCPGNNVDTPKNVYWCESNNPMNNRELTTQELYKLYKNE